MTAENTMSVNAVHLLIRDALMRSNTAQPAANSVARALVAAELAGQTGHGLRRVGSYAAQAACGKIDGQAQASLKQLRPGAALVDAAHGFAYPAVELAQEWLVEATPKQGIALAGITRSHHCGVAGVIVEALAEKGLVALLFANTPAAMAPWGAKQPIFGTDPIAFSCPLPKGDPITIDIALSKVARGKIMAAHQKGEDIPPDWALDADGNPTTDSAAALAGSMAPLGDAKGTVLALMVELLCAGLTGANFSYEQTSFLNAEGKPPGSGQALIAIDPGAFGDHAPTRFADMAHMLTSLDGARMPGARRHALKRAIERDGIAITQAQIDEIGAIGL